MILNLQVSSTALNEAMYALGQEWGQPTRYAMRGDKKIYRVWQFPARKGLVLTGKEGWPNRLARLLEAADFAAPTENYYLAIPGVAGYPFEGAHGDYPDDESLIVHSDMLYYLMEEYHGPLFVKKLGGEPTPLTEEEVAAYQMPAMQHVGQHLAAYGE